MTSTRLWWPFAAILALIGCSAPTPASETAPVVRGPLPTRTLHPVALTFLHMRPRRAVVQERHTWGAAIDSGYSSIFEVESAPGQRVKFDGEILRTSARVRYGIAPSMDLEVELAGVFASSGFMDTFIDEFHAIFGLPDAGREETLDDQYRMRLRRRGQLIYDLEEDRIGLGDIPIVITRQVRSEDENGPALAVRVGVEIPTGSRDRGYGNGELDYGAGFLLERSLGRWILTGAVDVVANGDPDAWEAAGVDALEMFHVQYGTEYRWNDRLSVLLQLYWTSPMTRDFDVEEFTRDILDFGLGMACDLSGGTRLFGAIKEDLIAATGPDFGVFLGASWGF